MSDVIDLLIEKNHGETFFGGKNGYDYICFNQQGKIECSGPLESMLKTGYKHNWAVAMLIPVRFHEFDAVTMGVK